MSNFATYCPEDNKLRLYVGRVPHEEYLKLRAEGWMSTPKQSCQFVATWTPRRRDTALAYSDGIIEDEDQDPQDRAADRAERFGGYREKRLNEATGHADRYDAGPSAHGFQNQARAERAAARHDRIATRAGDAWSKAEYWQRRTAGVISHALYVSAPDVRMGRIKTLEAEIRQLESRFIPRDASEIMQRNDQGESVPYVWCGQGRGGYWEEKSRLPAIEAASQEWLEHLRLRIAYENQMLEGQGGRAAHVEMIPGGFLGGRQIHRVNKSPVTGRVTSVHVQGPKVNGWTYKAGNVAGTDFALYQVDTERLAPGAYRPPTAEELAAFEATRQAIKQAKPKEDPCPLVNPTDADAEKLQAILNERAKADPRNRFSFEPKTVTRITQARYSANSKGAYARAETRGLSINCELADGVSNMYSRAAEERRARIGKPVCKVRITGYNPVSVIVITDKPQKPLPAAVWEKPFTLQSV